MDQENTKEGRPEDFSAILALAKRLANDTSLASSSFSRESFYAELIQNIEETPKLYSQLARKVRTTKYLTHEVEWVFDNFYIIQSVITDISKGVSKKDFKKLPYIRKGEKNVPRIYFILSEFVANFKSNLDKENLHYFIESYQEQVPLSLRELQIIPTFLKIILAEEIQLFITQLLTSLNEFAQAEFWFAKIKKTIKQEATPDFSKIIARLSAAYTIVPISVSFHLFERLVEEGSAVRPLIKWLRYNLQKQGVKPEELGDRESQNRNKLAENILHTINSLRWIDQTRWSNFISDVNPVDKVLDNDPAKVYSLMNTSSKEACRNSIQDLADKTGIVEVEIAQIALDLATENDNALQYKQNSAHENVANHVGFYLLDEGKKLLESKVALRPTLARKSKNHIIKNRTALYLGSIATLSIIGGYFYTAIIAPSVHPLIAIIFLSIALFVSSDIAVAIVNTIVMRFVSIRTMPRLSFSEGVPANATTFVVVPSMFRTTQSGIDLVQKLEAQYLGNKDTNIFFALLMDFKDAKTEHLPADALLLESIQQQIEVLNKKYADTIPRFYILHRKRIWNAHENVFMGWERKRGKLREFNELLRGKMDTSYVADFDFSTLPHISYIITIDEDTILPLGTAQELIGVIHHPLNRPVLSNGKIVRGYGIIQPRMSVRLMHAMKSLFSRLYVYAIGVDSYSSQIADIYHDLFGASVFQGKGIYDIDAVEETMNGKIPENAILSHDLLEGIYARTGFASDIQLFENFPSNYYEYIVRFSRWVRGDWQIISWLRPSKGFEAIDRWKIFDNIRRSLIQPALLLLIILSWFISPFVARATTIFSLIILATPFIIGFLFGLFSWGPNQTFLHKTKEIFKTVADLIAQLSIRAVSLFFSAISIAEAISTALWRMIVTHKHLLQWQTAHEVSSKITGSLREFYSLLWVSQVIPILIIAIDLFFVKSYLFEIYFWSLLWITAPFIAYLLSSTSEKKVLFTKDDKQFLRAVAVKTERFFLEQSNKENNFLIPDHAIPEPLSAKTFSVVSTSPTNIGMLLASFLSAYDFGHISSIDLVERLTRTFTTLSRLDRYKGHLYNWYDIKTLTPLTPIYVSTVDSANFLFALIALGQGLEEIPTKKILDDTARIGLSDILVTILDDIQRVKAQVKRTKTLKLIEKRVWAAILYLDGQTSSNPEAIQIWLTYALQVHNELETSLDELKSSLSNNGDALYAGIMHFKLAVTDIQELWKKFLTYTSFAPIELRDKIPTYAELADGTIRHQIVDPNNNTLLPKLMEAEAEAQKFLKCLEWCKAQTARFFEETDFGFLYNKERGLFHIGYNTAFNKIDNSYYDLLASEANAASFVAILKNQVPKKHWFYLGRKIVRSGQSGAMSSWGGSLFEYLTPLLYFDVHPESLIGHTAHVAVEAHQRYALRKHTPWGMGEAAYNSFDIHNNYQYQIFGEPSLGLKRGLEDRLVVAPYTTAMALSIAPQSGVKNLRRLIGEGVWGPFGFYDSIDYTVKKGFFKRKGVPVKIHYAHHEGFIAVAINNALNKNNFRTRFHNDPRVRATEILLEEKMPDVAPVRPIKNIEEFSPEYALLKEAGGRLKQYIPVRTKRPRYAFLGNGTYFVGLSNSGSGWSTYKDLAITRYREDPLSEPWGTFFYLYDEHSRAIWSPTFKPTRVLGKMQKILFSENKAEFSHTYNKIQTTLAVTIPQHDNLELRQITLKNTGDTERSLKVASYAELVMTHQKDDISHSSFQKLFIKSKVLPEYQALVFERKEAQQNQKPLYAAHFVSTTTEGSVSYVRNREDFMQGSDSLAQPGIFEKGIKDESTIPAFTLDPIMSIVKQVTLSPGETVTLHFITVAGDSYEDIIRIIKKYQRPKTIAQLMGASDVQSKNTAIQIGTSVQQALLFQKFMSTILSASWHPHRVEKLPTTFPLVQALWRSGVSGDMPYIVVRVKDIQDIPLVKSLLLFYKYVLFKGLAFDMIILNEYPSSYIKVMDDEIEFLLRISKTDDMLHAQGKIFHIKSDLLSAEDRQAILYMSRVIIDSKNGTFEQQLEKLDRTKAIQQLPALIVKRKIINRTQELPRPTGLILDNTVGGYDPIEKEYVMWLSKDNQPPAPWVNFLTNAAFGSIVNHRGASFTWSVDSYDNRLTAFHPDPLAEKGSEFFYIRDEETGEVWNPTPLSLAKGTFIVRHGMGYSIFQHSRSGIESSLRMSVPDNESLKIYKLTLKNTTRRTRKISVTTYHEVVLGIDRQDSKHGLRFEKREDNVITVQNIIRNNFGQKKVFFDLHNGQSIATIHRDEFIGRYGDYLLPEALKREALSGNLGYTAENCVALQTVIELEAGEEREIVLLVGEADSEEQITEKIHQYRATNAVQHSEQSLQKYWQGVQPFNVTTPDVALNTMFNQFTLYQLYSSRILSKTGYYQPGGAFGFRDLLQDSMAIVWSSPDFARSLIKKAATHQFIEGDVMNWWHEHNGFGIRTLFSDQHLWLPYVVQFYTANTGDSAFLDEQVSFMMAPPLVHGINMQWAGTPEKTSDTATIYEHCIRAIEYSLRFGHNKLPLIGAGDWNDGLNRTGQEGRGESVWLGWFMYTVLKNFIPVCEMKGEQALADKYRGIMEELKKALDKAWDGAWYRRAYLDNGLPLGSAVNREFKIDSIAQSWAVLSGAGDGEKVKQALASVQKHLISKTSVRLLNPPLENSTLDPGYIKNYPPGVRENAAQYNHAALWLAQAYFAHGDSETGKQIIDLVNPFARAADKEKMHVYRVEPYILASDIYATPSYEGRGGWTWYTGSAGIFYRTMIESICGIHKVGNTFSFNPCIPKEWPELSIDFKAGTTLYTITIKNPEHVARGVKSVTYDGMLMSENKITLMGDGKPHVIEVVLGN